MLTVLIPTHDDEERLAHMLPGLVRHAVSGAISEVIVFDSGSRDDTRRVADIAGCRFVSAGESPVDAVLASVRAPWILVLEPGARPVGDWIDVVGDHVAGPGVGAARLRIAPDPAAGWWQRLVGPGVGRRVFARGLLVSRRQAVALARPGMALDDIARGLAMQVLPAALIPARAAG